MLKVTKYECVGFEYATKRRQIMVYANIVAPLYWWDDFNTFTNGKVISSRSKLTKEIMDKEFTINDFSWQQLDSIAKEYLDNYIKALNIYRSRGDWSTVISLLPASYNQKRTIQVDFETLRAIYKKQIRSEVQEWKKFCRWIETLPYSEMIIGMGLAI